MAELNRELVLRFGRSVSEFGHWVQKFAAAVEMFKQLQMPPPANGMDLVDKKMNELQRALDDWEPEPPKVSFSESVDLHAIFPTVQIKPTSELTDAQVHLASRWYSGYLTTHGGPADGRPGERPTTQQIRELLAGAWWQVDNLGNILGATGGSHGSASQMAGS